MSFLENLFQNKNKSKVGPEVDLGRRELLIKGGKTIAALALANILSSSLFSCAYKTEKPPEKINVLGKEMTKEEIAQEMHKIFKPWANEINKASKEIAEENPFADYSKYPVKDFLETLKVVRLVGSRLNEKWETLEKNTKEELYLRTILIQFKKNYLDKIPKDEKGAINLTNNDNIEIIKKMELDLSNFFLSFNFLFNKEFQKKGGNIFIEMHEEKAGIREIKSLQEIFGEKLAQSDNNKVVYKINDPDFEQTAIITLASSDGEVTEKIIINKERMTFEKKLIEEAGLLEKDYWKMENPTEEHEKILLAHEIAHRLLIQQLLFNPKGNKFGNRFNYGIIDFSDKSKQLKAKIFLNRKNPDGTTSSKELKEGVVNSREIHEFIAGATEIIQSPKAAIPNFTNAILGSLLKLKKEASGLNEDVFFSEYENYSYINNFILDKIKQCYKKKGINIETFLNQAVPPKKEKDDKKRMETTNALTVKILHQLDSEDIDFIFKETKKQALFLLEEIKKLKN